MARRGLSGRVLDLGAGTGTTFPYLRGRGLEIHAIDPDPHMRRQAQRRADLGCEVGLRDVPSLPYPDGFFDWVVVSLVLRSVESVDEIARAY